jgi:signal peptidase II
MFEFDSNIFFSSNKSFLVKKQFLIGSFIVLIILIIDQSIKIWTKSNFENSYDSFNVIGTWLQFTYVENQGMAFGTTLGSGSWAKILLSSLRIVLIVCIVYYFIKQVKQGVRMEFVIALSLIIAGAFGNLIDSMLYDFIFKFDPCISFNQLEGSSIKHKCGFNGTVDVRPHGFLRGNVVDMFQFNVNWPSWVPYFKGSQVFPAIWNIADFSICCGVFYTILRQKYIFIKKNEPLRPIVESAEDENGEEQA